MDCGDASLADCRAFGGERLVKGDVLLAVEQSGEVEIAEVDTATAAEADDCVGNACWAVAEVFSVVNSSSNPVGSVCPAPTPSA